MSLPFGDKERQQLIEYVHGASDVESTIARVIASIPRDSHRIVHVGCGIGWLAHEASRQRAHASVVGIAASEAAVRVARTLFERDGLEFTSGDPSEAGRAKLGLADVVIVSGDELLAGDSEGAISASIAALAAPDATILMQGAGPRPAGETQRNRVVLESRKARAARARSRLGLRVTPDGYLIANPPGPAALIVVPVRNAPSETFIKAEIERLPGRVEILFGVFPHFQDENGCGLTPRWARGLERLVNVIEPRWSAGIGSYWLGRFLRRRRVAVVLAIYGPTGASLLATCRRRSIPLVTQFLGFDASDRPTIDEFRHAYACLLGEEAATIAVSRDIQRRLYLLGARPASVHWVPCGVDADRIVGADPGLNPPVFVAAGRFVEKKAPHLTLTAFSRVVADVPDARLQMVGGGPLLDACRQLAGALNIAGSVEFLGFRSHEDLATLMRGARAFVQHSVTAPSGDSEGMPVAILEAGAAGLPVVATRHGGIPEAVIDGETGFLVEEADVAAMADRMRELALDPALAERLGARARAHVREHFQLTDTLDQLWSVLQVAMSDDRQMAPC